jgi:hypothetical protein
MENNPFSISKIKAAGKNLKNIGITLFIGIMLLFIQVFYVMNIDVRSASDLESIKAVNVTFMILYIVFTVIIIWNFIDAGINLSSSAEDSSKEGVKHPILDNVILDSKLTLASPRTGEFSEGGIIVNSNQNDGHGLVCSIVDLGKVNWNDAVKLCAEYKEGGFSDWRLPSKDELSLIFILLHKEKGIGSFFTHGKTGYWCSNEINKNEATEIHFEYGKEGVYRKSISNYVRAVRSF